MWWDWWVSINWRRLFLADGKHCWNFLPQILGYLGRGIPKKQLPIYAQKMKMTPVPHSYSRLETELKERLMETRNKWEHSPVNTILNFITFPWTQTMNLQVRTPDVYRANHNTTEIGLWLGIRSDCDTKRKRGWVIYLTLFET